MRPRGETVFKEDFAKVTSAALPDCWFFESADEMITWKAIFDAQQNNGYVTIDKLASAEVNTQLYVQSVNIDAAGKYDVSFRYQRMENGEKLGSEDSDGTVDASAGKGVKVWISNNPTLDGARQLDFIPLNYELAPAEAVPGWYTYECNIDLTDNVYVIFDANTELCRIDDIEVKLAPACRDPKYIVVKETTATDATITWRGDNRQSAWKVSYTLTDLTGQAQPKVVTDADATGFEYKFTDLTGSTRYRVEGTVTAACGSTNSAAVPFKFDFETVCDPITGIDATPFIEKFDGTLFAPVCWSQNQVKKGDKIGNTDINYRDTAWVRTTEAQYVAEGTGAAMLRAANSGAQTDLISPAIEIPEEASTA